MTRYLLCLGVSLLVASSGSAYYPMAANQPRVCNASLQGGKLKLRYLQGMPPRVEEMTGTEKNDKGEEQPFTFKVTRRSSLERTLLVEPSVVDVYTTDGKKIDGKDLPGLLSDRETPVLACSEKPNLDVLKIAKKGTMLLIIPVHLDMLGGGGTAIPAVPIPVDPPKEAPKEKPKESPEKP